MFDLEKILNKIIKYGLYAILLTPLAFWPKALYAFLTPKFILFQILVEIVFGAWLALLALRNTNTRIHANDTNKNELNSRHSYSNLYHLYWRKWLIISLFIFLSASFLSAIFGIDFSRSFWGIGARMTGLFAELHFLAWFLMLTTAFSNTNNINNNANNTNKNIRDICMPFVNSYYYINFSFAVSILVALTAFYQNTTWHLVPGYTIFSNPTFVAPYFLFHFFWGLYQILNLKTQNSKLKTWFFGIGSALILWAIILGQIRGAFVGLFLGLLFLGLGLIFSNIFKTRLRILTAVFCAAVILSLPFILQFTRFSHTSFNDATVQTRLLTWQAALKGFGSAGWRIIFGTGPENFNYLFNANYNPHLLIYGGSSFAETWQDKPHNAFIEILTEAGIIGGSAYVLLWFFVALGLYKVFKKGDKFLSLVLASAFISYLGTMFFSFDSFGSWFGLFLFLAFLVSHDSNTNTRIYTNDTNKINSKVKAFVSFVCLFVLFALLYVNFGIWQANVADADALRYFGRDSDAGLAFFKKSLSYFSPYKSEYRFDLAASVGGAIEKGIPISNLEDTINFALSEADKAVAAHPNNAAGYTDMLRIYNILGSKGRDPNILNQAEKFGERSLELSPNRQETFFYLARTALLKNNPELAVRLTKQALDIDPTINVSHWYLGLSYIANNQTNEGRAEIKKALALGYQPQNQKEKDFIKNLGL